MIRSERWTHHRSLKDCRAWMRQSSTKLMLSLFISRFLEVDSNIGTLRAYAFKHLKE